MNDDHDSQSQQATTGVAETSSAYRSSRQCALTTFRRFRVARSTGTSGSKGTQVAPEYVVARIARTSSRPFSNQMATIGALLRPEALVRVDMDLEIDVASESASRYVIFLSP